MLDPETLPVDPESDTEARFPMLIAFEGVPGPHMEPMNKLAEDVVKKHFPDGRVNLDPITSLAPI